MRPVCEDLHDSAINAHGDEFEIDRFEKVSLAGGEGPSRNEGTVFQCRFVVVKIGYYLFEDFSGNRAFRKHFLVWESSARTADTKFD